MKLLFFLGNYDSPTNKPRNGQTNDNRYVHMEQQQTVISDGLMDVRTDKAACKGILTQQGSRLKHR